MGRGYIRNRPERAVEEATEAQVQAMQAKLKARIGQVQGSGMAPREAHNLERTGSIPAPATNLPQAGQSPKAKSKLEWEKPVAGATGVKTKCGRYSCCKVTVNDKTHYELWRTVPDGSWRTPINQHLDNFLQAQELARQDAEKRL